MNKEIKTKWVAALRSRKYEQGHGTLFGSDDFGKDGYCCLGVLCDIQFPQTWMHEIENKQISTLPNKYAAGLNEDEMAYLANLNDEGHSFETIADVIENNKYPEDIYKMSLEG